jgi:hypothetical protein
MKSASTTIRAGAAIHALGVIKNACLEALDDDEPDIALFRAVVDPSSVWELATTVEQLQAEVAALKQELQTTKAEQAR